MADPSSIIQDQSTLLADDPYKHLPKRICLVGSMQFDDQVVTASKRFNVPIVNSVNGANFLGDLKLNTYFIVPDFDGVEFEQLHLCNAKLVAKPAFLDMADEGYLMDITRPLYCNTMRNCGVVSTGFRKKSEVGRLLRLIHHMGGSMKTQVSDQKVTHVLAHVCGGEKYQYAVTFDVPVMSSEWVDAAWAHRDERSVKAESEALMRYKVSLFHNVHIAIVGFSEEDASKMTELVEKGGGKMVPLTDPNATHIVIEDISVTEKPTYASERAAVVKAEWFWSSVQMEVCANEQMHSFEPQNASAILSPRARMFCSGGTPGSRSRRRKRLRETVQQLAENESPALGSCLPASKRRSSVNDLAFMSGDGSFLDDSLPVSSPRVPDQTPLSPPALDMRQISPRQRVFQELCMTECNYVSILDTIQTVIKEPLENPNQLGGPMLDMQDLRYIFGNLPPIHEVHSKLRNNILHIAHHWTDDCAIGKTILTYTAELEKAYPPFVNYFENVKDLLQKRISEKPRFHAFLKIAQSRPECGRQNFTELLIRPVQRLPSMSLLLGDLVKHTDKHNPDYEDLKNAVDRVKSIMTLINDDKRKTEAKLKLFEIHNDIENCPPNLVASHRTYFGQVEAVEVNNSVATRGDTLCLFLFNDVVEICKKKSKFNSLKSPSRANVNVRIKGFKHIEMVPLLHIKRVIDLREQEVCKNTVALIIRSSQEMKERLYTFTILPEEMEKQAFIKLLCVNIASCFCRSDVENFSVVMESEMLDIDTSEVMQNNGISKAIRFATKTGRKVSRAFSFNKSPGKLKRAVSTVMSPFTTSHHALRSATSVNNISAMNPPCTPTTTTMPAPTTTPTSRRRHTIRRLL